MAELCSANPSLARKILTLILQRLSSVGQAPTATAIEVSEATVSRLKSEHLKTFTDLLAALGLKVVESHYRCYDPAHVAHLEYFARIGLSQQTSPLTWEEDA